jgi:hypothetical protein
MIQKYQKKPVTIEAIQWTKETMDEALTWMPSNRLVIRVLGMEDSNDSLQWTYEYSIQTLEGDMKISDGDFIIKGVKGEFYPCKPDIFEMTYDKVYVTEEQEPILELKEMDQDPTIKFMTKGPEEVIRISKGKFYFRGEEVEDKYQVYERFNEWMTMAEEPVSKSTWKDLKFNETKIDNINW